jgi:hypothetical protein
MDREIEILRFALKFEGESKDLDYLQNIQRDSGFTR